MSFMLDSLAEIDSLFNFDYYDSDSGDNATSSQLDFSLEYDDFRDSYDSSQLVNISSPSSSPYSSSAGSSSLTSSGSSSNSDSPLLSETHSELFLSPTSSIPGSEVSYETPMDSEVLSNNPLTISPAAYSDSIISVFGFAEQPWCLFPLLPILFRTAEMESQSSHPLPGLPDAESIQRTLEVPSSLLISSNHPQGNSYDMLTVQAESSLIHSPSSPSSSGLSSSSASTSSAPDVHYKSAQSSGQSRGTKRKYRREPSSSPSSSSEIAEAFVSSCTLDYSLKSPTRPRRANKKVFYGSGEDLDADEGSEYAAGHSDMEELRDSPKRRRCRTQAGTTRSRKAPATQRHNPKSNARKHPCPIDGCKKSFSRQHDAVRHVLTSHDCSGPRCDACDRKYSRRDALIRHRANPPLRCPLNPNFMEQKSSPVP